MWEAISAMAASISVVVAMSVLLTSLYKTKPRISIRWNVSYRDMSVEFVNTGERMAERVQVEFENFNRIYDSPNKYPLFLFKDDKRVFTLLPGESYTVPLASPVTVGQLVEDEDVENRLNIKGEWNYRSWVFRRLKRERAEWRYLQWDDYYKTLIPPEPAEDSLVKSVNKLTKEMVPQVKKIGYQLKRRFFEQSNADKLDMRVKFESRAHLMAWSIAKELGGQYTEPHYLGSTGERLIFRVREQEGGLAIIEVGYERPYVKGLQVNDHHHTYEEAFDKVKEAADIIWEQVARQRLEDTFSDRRSMPLGG